MIIREVKSGGLFETYFFFSFKLGPCVYFFAERDSSNSTPDENFQVSYVGKSKELLSRLKYGRHHRLKPGTPKRIYYYIPFPNITDDKLKQVESCFIHLLLPRDNQGHMPRIDRTTPDWVKTLIKYLGRDRKAKLRQFLLDNKDEIPTGGTWMLKLIQQDLDNCVPEEERRGLL